MKAQSFEYRLQHTLPPAPDPQAQLRAKRAALEEFERVYGRRSEPSPAAPASVERFLGSLGFSRDRQNPTPAIWRWRTALWGGIASACVAVIGGSVVWLSLKQPRETPLRPPVASEVQSAPEHATEMERSVEQPPAIAQQIVVAEGKTDGRSTVDAPSPNENRQFSKRVTRMGQPPTQAQDIPAPSSEPSSPEETAETATLNEVLVQGARIQAEQSAKRMALPMLDGLYPDSDSRELEEVTVTGTPHARKRSLLSRRASARVRSAVVLPSEGRDKFQHFDTNPVKRVADDPVSTFSVDVDTASYSFVRRRLNEGVLPQVDSVRVEEMINYFDYGWPAPPAREQPFRPTVAVSDSPWGEGKKLIHIGIKGYSLPAGQQPDANLVLLLDVSGSMDSPDKLPLAKQSMALLLDSLKPTDTIAIVVYAGAAGQVLTPTPVEEKETILQALDSLRPGGSTAGAAGIQLAYELAEKSFRRNGVNRILLATDGDFNVGITDQNELKGFVEREREKGIYLSVLGFGQGNYRDEMAQALAQNGNGVAAYIDTLDEAKKVLVQQATSSLFTIAKDVKLQVEFNPATVAEYRLVGYETRALNREDFNNDKVDAGDVGAGHTVTAIYEITPVGSNATLIDESRYADRNRSSDPRQGKANEYGFLKIRYKLPKGFRSRLIEQPIPIDAGVPAALGPDVQFSTAVAGFAQLLRGGKYVGSYSFEDVIRQAQGALGEDPHGYRAEFVQLVRKAQHARGM